MIGPYLPPNHGPLEAHVRGWTFCHLSHTMGGIIHWRIRRTRTWHFSARTFTPSYATRHHLSLPILEKCYMMAPILDALVSVRNIHVIWLVSSILLKSFIPLEVEGKRKLACSTAKRPRLDEIHTVGDERRGGVLFLNYTTRMGRDEVINMFLDTT